LFFILLAASSCAPKITTTSQVKDSVRVEYIPRQVPIYIPGDTVTVTEWIKCDSVTNKPVPMKVKSKKGRATLTVEVKPTGQLDASSSCDSLHQIITTLDKEVFRLRHESKTTTVEVFKTRTIDKVCRWVAGLAVLALAGFIVFKIYL
jgi:hypothetical protein